MKHIEYIIPIGEEAQDYDEMFIGVIRRQPELVRCKDCKHWSADDNETYCEELGIFGTSPNSFCSFARKKEEPTMEEFMCGQNLGNPEDGSL